MGCGGFEFAGVGMVVVCLGLLAWVWGLWAVATVKDNHQLLQSLSIQDKHQTAQQLKDFSNPTTQDNNKS